MTEILIGYRVISPNVCLLHAHHYTFWVFFSNSTTSDCHAQQRGITVATMLVKIPNICVSYVFSTNPVRSVSI